MNLPTVEFQNTPNNHLYHRLQVIGNLSEVHCYLNFNKGGIAQKLLHEIKYKGQEDLGVRIGEWFGYHILNMEKAGNFDMIVPIPLHPTKRKRRGYNQSELIANGLSGSLGIPCEPKLLARTKYTSTQTKKGKIERWLNVNDIFKIDTNDNLENKHILLVDDVITTGATIESAADLLNQNGVSRISIACIAAGR